MTEVTRLIQELCPNGVEYKKLGEVCAMKRGTSLTKKDAVEGDIPVISGGREPAFFHNVANRFDSVVTVAGSGAGAGYVQYFDVPIFANDCFTLEGNEGIFTKYVYYCLLSIQNRISATKKGSGVPHVHISDIAHFKIPVPPLEVQKAIVQELDAVHELERELERELELRREQYASLLDYMFSDWLARESKALGGIEWKKLGDCAVSVCSGGTPKRNIPSYYSGDIPWLRTQDINFDDVYSTSMTISDLGLENSSAKWIPANCLVIAMYGATAAKCAINKIPLTTNQACCNLQFDENNLLVKYAFYYMCRSYLDLRNLGEGSQHNINAMKIKSFEIPVPPLSVQEKLVSILDAHVDMTSDLQHEIDLRREQLEAVRDMRLSFEQVA